MLIITPCEKHQKEEKREVLEKCPKCQTNEKKEEKSQLNCAICDIEFEYSAVREIDLCKKCYLKVERQLPKQETR